MKKTYTLALAAMLAICSSVPAQVFLTGNITEPNWSPGSGAALTGGTAVAADYELLDDGVAPDAAAGDGVFTMELTVAEMGLTPGADHEYKIAGAGFSPDPMAENARLVVPASAVGTDVLTFTLDTRENADGFVPDGAGSGTAGTGFAYNSFIDDFLSAATTINITGDFQTTAFDAPNGPAMTFNGTSGFYEYTFSGLAGGTYNFKIVTDGDFAPADFGTAGLGGGNHSFTLLSTLDSALVELDPATGRVRATSQLAVPGPPFFAQSSAWGNSFDSATIMVDNGTYFARLFTIATPGDYEVRVRQGIGRTFPDTGNYPFTTTTPNQDIVVILDRATYTDNYAPDSDFVVVLDEATRTGLNTFSKVQPVGSWQSEFGASDWDAGVAAMDILDDGNAPDGTAGDNIHSGNLTELDATGVTGANYKAVGQRAGGSDSGFTIQFGGSVDGLTITGNNANSVRDFLALTEYTFKVDTVTGRMGVEESGTGIADPDRTAEYWTPSTGNLTPAFNAVTTDWTSYE